MRVQPSRLVSAWPARWPAGTGFALRTTAGSLLALYVALLASMEHPKWAAMTVFIVAQADRGMSLVKARNRIGGTLAGACMATVLMAVFAQMPVLFLASLALWLGACTAAASLQAGFRAYGAVLAGYTAVIVGMSATEHPEDIFNVAVARTTEIVLGIAIEGALAAAASPFSAQAALARRLEDYLDKGHALCARLLRDEAAGLDVHRFFVAALQFNEMVDYAAAASHQAARLAGRLQRITYLMLEQLMAAHACPAAMAVGGEVLAMQQLRIWLAQRGRAAGPAAAGLRSLQARLRAMGARLQAAPPADDVLERCLMLDRAGQVARHMLEIEQERAAFVRGEPAGRGMAMPRHRDWPHALHNGLRAVLAMAGAAWFWIDSGWATGAGLVVIVGVVCALFSTRPNPVAGAMGFLKGTALAAVAALVCDVWLLPQVRDFGGLVVVLAPCLVAAGLAMQRPATAALGSSFPIFYLDLLAPVNGHAIEVIQLLNGALTLLLGIAIGVAAFTLLLPANARARARRLRRVVDADLADIARHPARYARQRWMGLMADRMRHRLGVSGADQDGWLADDLAALLAALTVGVDVIALASPQAPADPVLARVVRRLARQDLAGTALAAARAARRKARLAYRRPDVAGAGDWARVLCLWDLARAARQRAGSSATMRGEQATG